MNNVEFPGKWVTVCEIDYHELEEFVKKVYPEIKDYDFPCVEECSNDSSHSFTVDGTMDDYTKREMQEIKESGVVGTYRNRAIMSSLCHDGFIKPGTYIVEVCW